MVTSSVAPSQKRVDILRYRIVGNCHEFWGFVAICKDFPDKMLFSTNSQKFSPTKVSCYTVHISGMPYFQTTATKMMTVYACDYIPQKNA